MRKMWKWIGIASLTEIVIVNGWWWQAAIIGTVALIFAGLVQELTERVEMQELEYREKLRRLRSGE